MGHFSCTLVTHQVLLKVLLSCRVALILYSSQNTSRLTSSLVFGIQPPLHLMEMVYASLRGSTYSPRAIHTLLSLQLVFFAILLTTSSRSRFFFFFNVAIQTRHGSESSRGCKHSAFLPFFCFCFICEKMHFLFSQRPLQPSPHAPIPQAWYSQGGRKGV